MKELDLEDGLVLKVIKLLYRVLEAGNYKFKTYYSYYINELAIK